MLTIKRVADEIGAIPLSFDISDFKINTTKGQRGIALLDGKLTLWLKRY
jgi:hypothetical protein